MINLRDYQMDMVNRVRQGMRTNKWQLLQLVTGGGKTFTSGYMIDSARRKGKTCYFVVPRRELLKQTAESYSSVGIPFGYIAAGYRPSPFEKVQLCTVGSLVRRLDKVRKPDLIFLDETQYGAGQLGQIIEWAKAGGAYGVGLSATPDRTDGTGLGMWYDNMVEGPSMRDMIDKGNLSEFRLFAPDTPDLSGIRTVAGDYAKGELAEKMEQDRVLVGNSVRHYKQLANGMLNVAFCASVKHSKIVARSFRDADVPAYHISGDMDDAERSRIIKAFSRREIKVLTSCQMLQFGFDLSSAAQMDVTVESISDLQPTKSLSLQLQKYGRALRKKDFPAVILDHAGNSGRHGLPDDDREWTLNDRERRKRSDVEKTEPTRQCTECFFVMRPQPVCPSCGHVFPIQSRMIEEVDGDLAEVTSPVKKMKKPQEIGMIARTDGLKGLIEYGKSKGYAPGWARKQAQVRGIRG